MLTFKGLRLKMVLPAGIEPTSFPNLGIMVYKTTALPLCYGSKLEPTFGFEPKPTSFAGKRSLQLSYVDLYPRKDLDLHLHP